MWAAPSLSFLPASTENSAAALRQPWGIPKQHELYSAPRNSTTCTLHQGPFAKKKRRVVIIRISLIRGMEARFNTQESLLSPTSWGEGHYWKTFHSWEAFWLLSLTGCLNWQQRNNKEKSEGNQKRPQGPGVIARGIRSTGIDFRDGSEK